MLLTRSDLVLPGRTSWRSIAAPSFAGALALGLICGYCEIPAAVWICAWAAWSVVAAMNRLALRLSPQYRAGMGWVVAMIAAVCLGAASMNRVDSLARVSVARFAGHEVVLTGAVVSSRAGGRSPEVVIAAITADVDGALDRVVGKVRLTFEPGDASFWWVGLLRYGDLLESRVRLELASCSMNPGEPDFRAVLLQQGIHALANVSSRLVRVVGRRRLNPVEYIAQLARERIVTAAHAILAPGQCETFLAMALGDSGELDFDTLQDFRRAGVSHLLAASGLHVSLVVGIAVQVASVAGASSRRLPLIGFLVSGIYAVVAGLRPSIVRAWLMFGLSAASRACGRQASALRIVCISASVQLLFNPVLLWNSGFQMSYLAILALSYLAPCLVQAVPAKTTGATASGLRTLLTSLAVSAALLPIVANMTSEVSLVGPLANLIAVPLGLVAMAAGLGGCAVWLVWPWLGSVMGAGAGAMFTALSSFVSLMSSLPLSSVPVRRFSHVEVTAYYVLVVCVCAFGSDEFGWFRFRRAVGKVARRPSAAMCGAGVISILVAIVALGPAPLEVVVMSVGQGDAIFVSGPKGVSILIDTGTAYAGARHVAPYLRRRGIRRIDLLVITHEHADHAGGAGAVVGSFRTECLAVPSGASGAAWDGVLGALAAARGGGLPPVIRLSEGDIVRVGDVTLEALNPPAAPIAAEAGQNTDANEGSLVLRLAYQSFSMLLCADAGAGFERHILGDPSYRASLAAQVVKIGHHGSSGASSSRFLDAVGPSLAIVSVGRNGYGHPSPVAVGRILDSGAELRRTDTCGAVSVGIAPRSIGKTERSATCYTVRDMRSVWARAPMFRKLETWATPRGTQPSR